MFPATLLRRVLLTEKGGERKTRFYLVVNDDQKRAIAIMVKGRGSFVGQIEVYSSKNGLTITEFASLVDDLIKEVKNQRFRVDSDESVEIQSEAHLRRQLMSVWNRLGWENLDFVFPGIDTTGVRAPNNPEFAKVGDKWVKVEKPPMPMPEIAAPSVTELAASDPTWGSF